MTRRIALSTTLAFVLAAVAVWCADRGVTVRSSVGGLLVEPVPTVRVVGGWVAAAVLAGTVALLLALEAVHALRVGRALRSAPARHPSPPAT